jgi:hypothetical protein
MNTKDLRNLIREVLENYTINENFFSVNDKEFTNPLTKEILSKIFSKLPSSSRPNKMPEIEASGAEGIVFSLDDYRVIKIFHNLANAAKVAPLMNKNLDVTSNVFSVGTIKLDEKVFYQKKGSSYSALDSEPTDTLYYVVMERVNPDPKIYRQIEINYWKFTLLHMVNNIDVINNWIAFINNSGSELLKNNLDNIFREFIADEGFDLEPKDIYELFKTKQPKKQFNVTFQKFSVWKKKKTKLSFLIDKNGRPLLLKNFIKSYIGNIDLGFKVNSMMEYFLNILPGNVKDIALKVIALIKSIVVDLNIPWNDIHEEQFGYSPTTKKIIAIDLGVKSSGNSTNAFSKNVHTVSIKKSVRNTLNTVNTLSEIDEGGNKIDTINFFDFDGTLMLTYGPEEGKEKFKQITGLEYPHEGWVGRPESLMPELETPRNESMYSIYKSVTTPNSYNVILSNRLFKLEEEVAKTLSDNQINFDEIKLKRGNISKSDRLLEVFEKFPNVTTINVFDDLESELNEIKLNVKDLYSIWRDDLTINLYLVTPNSVTPFNATKTMIREMVRKSFSEIM